MTVKKSEILEVQVFTKTFIVIIFYKSGKKVKTHISYMPKTAKLFCQKHKDISPVGYVKLYRANDKNKNNIRWEYANAKQGAAEKDEKLEDKLYNSAKSRLIDSIFSLYYPYQYFDTIVYNLDFYDIYKCTTGESLPHLIIKNGNKHDVIGYINKEVDLNFLSRKEIKDIIVKFINEE